MQGWVQGLAKAVPSLLAILPAIYRNFGENKFLAKFEQNTRYMYQSSIDFMGERLDR